ncbi:MAG: helix-turn-helix transcriptional regulator [bacterium]
MKRQNLLLYRAHSCRVHELRKACSKCFELLNAYDVSQAVFYLTNNNVVGVTTELPRNDFRALDDILYFRDSFQTCPIILLGSQANLRRIREDIDDGQIFYIPYEKLDRRIRQIPSFISQSSFVPDVSVLGIRVEKCSARIKKALDIILHAFLKQELTVCKLAFKLNVHRCHLDREFQHYCEISPKQVIMGLKLSYATFLMKNDGMKLFHVAQLAGFPDYYEFCKIFSRHMGMTPSQYRDHISGLDFGSCFKPLRRIAK